MKPDPSLKKRLIVAAIIVPVLVVFSWLGGWPFALLIAAVTGLAAVELWRLFQSGDYSPSLVLIILFVIGAVLLRYWLGLKFTDLYLAVLVLAAMLYHVLSQKPNRNHSAASLFITIGGPLYVGWLGAYAVSIRNLENGAYWILLVLVIIAMADTGAYAVGRATGRHKMFPLISPKKSWEGYIGGVITGILSGWGVAALWQTIIPSIHPIHGIILGAAISIIAPMGDFGESLIKRCFNVKDSSNILLDHGGFLDRIDSALWAVTIGYYLIVLITG